MNKEELISLKRKSKELKEVRKELELYKLALKISCTNSEYGSEYKRKIGTRFLRNFYINEAKRRLNNGH